MRPGGFTQDGARLPRSAREKPPRGVPRDRRERPRRRGTRQQKMFANVLWAKLPATNSAELASQGPLHGLAEGASGSRRNLAGFGSPAVLPPGCRTGSRTDSQTDSWTDSWTDSQTGSWTDSQTGSWTDSQTGSWTPLGSPSARSWPAGARARSLRARDPRHLLGDRPERLSVKTPAPTRAFARAGLAFRDSPPFSN